MSTSNARNATRTTLWKEDGAFGSGNYVKIAEQINVGGLEIDTEFDDVTTMDSTGYFRERLAVLLDAKPVQVTGHYLHDDATHNATTGLLADQVAMTKKNFQIRLGNDIARVTFAGFVGNTKPDFPLGKKMGFSFMVMPTGQPTLP